MVVRDTDTNYAEDRSRFTEELGLAATEWDLVRDALQRDTSLASVSNFSSQVSGTMKRQAIVAMALSLLAVVGYIWLRFGSLRYGLAAIAALVHDVSITLGILAICGYLTNIPGFHQALLLDDFKINLALVAALLTIVGYSLNDTIVVFDRIRENRGRLSRATPAIVNDSINQTVSRTVLTSGTTLIAVLTLYVLGGPGVHGFAFAMLIGVMVGTYSSIAIAAPILLIGDKSEVRVLDDPEPTPPSASGGALAEVS
ncbi:MAG: protein translocase subunit SecF [Planctomycetota bacterium]